MPEHQKQPTCQICGGLIKGKPYYWDDNSLLPMHANMTRCQGNGNVLFVAFMNRNVEYINRRGEPVLLEV
ncbi:hypothetical protein LCGC14_0532380 [marine sediment metagenome]|uniref:Uncharacterized protein n=1 Tax=marine sediment metagenome TaxID=412755 RepID=A0A0F9S002_9ZZZZ